MPNLLTIDEAAELLRLTRSTLYKYTMSKRIPYVRLNGVLRFDADRLSRWVTERSVEPLVGRAVTNAKVAARPA